MKLRPIHRPCTCSMDGTPQVRCTLERREIGAIMGLERWARKLECELSSWSTCCSRISSIRSSSPPTFRDAAHGWTWRQTGRIPLLRTVTVGGTVIITGARRAIRRAVRPGGVRWRAEADKQGQYSVTPIREDVRKALDQYLRENPRVGHAPLFPSPGTRPDPSAGTWSPHGY